jgi:signal transduction histidine kinase
VYPLTAENLDPVLAQNRLLTRLVEDLRTLALAESGQLSLERTPVDFSVFAQRVVDRFQPQAEARQVKLKVDIGSLPPGMSPILQIDSNRMEQILGNLLANALRYTSEGGEVLVRIEWGPKTARLSVCDSGPGIPPEALPHIFERFYRADKSRSRSEGGTGLGLAIARQLAEAHGGTLTAENALEGGAKFILTLGL